MNDNQDKQLSALLQDYPAPQPDADFFDRALARATHEGSRRQRNRWLATGFGAAVAAGLALWMVGGLLLDSPERPVAEPQVPRITMTLQEPRTVNLVFASAESLDAATLTVQLPDGVEMSGFPGQREVTWETSLAAGKNLLPLKLIASSRLGGEIYATIRHQDQDRTFRLRVDVS